MDSVRSWCGARSSYITARLRASRIPLTRGTPAAMLRRRRGRLIHWPAERRSSRVLPELRDSKSRECPDLQQVRVLDEERGAQVQRDDAHDEPTGRRSRSGRTSASRRWWCTGRRAARVGSARVSRRGSADGSRSRRGSDERWCRRRRSDRRSAGCTEPLEGNDRRCGSSDRRSSTRSAGRRARSGSSAGSACGPTATSVRFPEPSERARGNGRVQRWPGSGREHRSASCGRSRTSAVGRLR